MKIRKEKDFDQSEKLMKSSFQNWVYADVPGFSFA
jgi:hypothetical protein